MESVFVMGLTTLGKGERDSHSQAAQEGGQCERKGQEVEYVCNRSQGEVTDHGVRI